MVQKCIESVDFKFGNDLVDQYIKYTNIHFGTLEINGIEAFYVVLQCCKILS